MKVYFLLFAALLCGCASIEPVPGAPEVHACNPVANATVTVMPDGSRFVVVNRAGEIQATILLPPAKVEKAQ